MPEFLFLEAELSRRKYLIVNYFIDSVIPSHVSSAEQTSVRVPPHDWVKTFSISVLEFVINLSQLLFTRLRRVSQEIRCGAMG